MGITGARGQGHRGPPLGSGSGKAGAQVLEPVANIGLSAHVWKFNQPGTPLLNPQGGEVGIFLKI